MKSEKLLIYPLFVAAVLALSAVAFAQAPVPTYQQIATIPIPGGLASFDISWIDPGTARFYLADRTTTKGAGRIDVIDTQQSKFLYSIGGFVGNVGPGVSGPNGVVAVPQLNQLYVGDGDSNVKVVDLATKTIIATIPTGGKFRADELAYDPLDHIIMITNPNDSPAYVTFISTDTQTVLGRYTYPSSQSGLEQPVWNPLIKRFMMSVPANPYSSGQVDVINPKTMLVENSFGTACSPAGLALTPNQRAMTSCGVAVDGRTGRILQQTFGASGDEIWYNPGDNRFYFGSASVAAVDAETFQFLGYVTTGATGAHSIAVDPGNNHIFVPTAGVGVNVFAAQ